MSANGLNEIDISKSNVQDILARIRKEFHQADTKAFYIRKNLPDLAEITIQKANYALEGLFRLPGTGGKKVFAGNPPDWYRRVNNDNEYLWQLNRMEHWQPLLQAYSLTGEERYARKVIDELENWIQSVPVINRPEDYDIDYFEQCHPLRLLECGIRLYKTWPLIIEHLGSSPLLTVKLLEKYLLSVISQTRLLAYYAPLLWPLADHNHYLMENLGILTTACYFPELQQSDEWKSQAIRELERCSKMQLTKMGGQIEGCPSYHNGTMFWFGWVILLARRFSIEISSHYLERYRKNLNYSLYCLRPTGTTVPVGDSHANNLSIMAAVYGYLALGDMYWLNHISRIISKEVIIQTAYQYIWHGNSAGQFIRDMGEITGMPKEQELPLNLFNPVLGQVMMRQSWDDKASSLLMTCRSPIQNFHAHIDLMSFDYTALGKNLICDPGLFTYREDLDREEFKTTASHSTIMIDGHNQFEYRGSFDYGPQNKGMILSMEEKELYTIATACHECYLPVKIYRHIILMKNGIVIIADELENLNQNEVRRTFHLDYTNVKKIKYGVEGIDKKVNFKVLSFPETNCELFSGRLSDENDTYRASVKAVFTGSESGNKTFLTLLIPFAHNDKDPGISIDAAAGGYKVKLNNRTYNIRLADHEIRILCNSSDCCRLSTI